MTDVPRTTRIRWTLEVTIAPIVLVGMTGSLAGVLVVSILDDSKLPDFWQALLWVNVLVVLGSIAVWLVPIAGRDPVGVLSVAVPAAVLALASVAPLNASVRLAFGCLAAGYLVMFQAGENRLWSWWTQHVLQRGLPSPQRLFERELKASARSFWDATWFIAPELPRGAGLPQAVVALDQLRSLAAPDAAWASLRDDMVTLFDQELLIFRAAGRDDHLLAELMTIGARWEVLRGKEPEWKGLYPTLNPAEIHHDAASSPVAQTHSDPGSPGSD